MRWTICSGDSKDLVDCNEQMSEYVYAWVSVYCLNEHEYADCGVVEWPQFRWISNKTKKKTTKCVSLAY